MILAVMVQRFYRCRCGRKFAPGSSDDEVREHLQHAPTQCRVDVHLRVVVGEDPRTLKQVEEELGVPAEMIELDPPVGGLYYSYRLPCWTEWLSVPEFSDWLAVRRGY